MHPKDVMTCRIELVTSWERTTSGICVHQDDVPMWLNSIIDEVDDIKKACGLI